MVGIRSSSLTHYNGLWPSLTCRRSLFKTNNDAICAIHEVWLFNSWVAVQPLLGVPFAAEVQDGRRAITRPWPLNNFYLNKKGQR